MVLYMEHASPVCQMDTEMYMREKILPSDFLFSGDSFTSMQPLVYADNMGDSSPSPVGRLKFFTQFLLYMKKTFKKCIPYDE